MILCLFEDRLAGNFAPVALTRHLSHLLVGAMTLRDRAVTAVAPERVVLHGRSYIRDYYRAAGELVDRPDRPTLFVNARLLITPKLHARFPQGDEWLLKYRGEVIAAQLKERSVTMLDWSADALDFSLLGEMETHQLESAPLYEYLWDLIYDNGERIIDDFPDLNAGQQGTVMSGAHLVNPARITIGSGSVVRPGAVLDATLGPIIIARDVEVMSNAVIEGPCHIGDHCRIKIGAKIYEKTSIGPWCKVGGEVENSIILGYSNKQHDGFLGHSYLGRWVNLGADTNTSDLKNNYGMIRITQEGREVDTGRMFLGTLFGDHAKTGINTMLNTGSVIGVAANVFGGGFPPKSIPSFAWGGSDGFERFDLDKALELARRVMSRRDVEFTDADEKLIRYLAQKSMGDSR
jgi:UDP-N-acetylglucosamine diphosphorylase/glucosamine-1-phosphate N-acetyltransferase